jgi:hypothetical protein
MVSYLACFLETLIYTLLACFFAFCPKAYSSSLGMLNHRVRPVFYFVFCLIACINEMMEVDQRTQSPSLLVEFFLEGWDWSLSSGVHTYKAGTRLLEPHLQSILLWLF